MASNRDAEIQKRVLQELKWDSRVDETEVGVEVDKGIVTLTGTVESYDRKVAAQEAAHRVFGVLDVANDIRLKVVGSFMRTDADIAMAVRGALESGVVMSHTRIRSTVTDGWVYLEGTVDRLTECEDAERVVCNLRGVRGVTNNILVKPAEVRPEELHGTIEEALARHAQRLARRIADSIQVDVKEGIVTLSGNVRSWPERDAVVGAVGHVLGIQGVKDLLHIDP
jgi:osmotically-inducible protein OsmY